jgi:hypothetical protein
LSRIVAARMGAQSSTYERTRAPPPGA